jgi:purine-binding chemotaxis protein CheW
MDGIRKSERILEQVRKRREEARIVDVDEERVKLVVFTLLDDHFAFPGAEIKEILPLMNIAYVPGAPDSILGIINVRGDVESVLSGHKVLGLPHSEPTSRSRIVIADSNGARSGILVDSIEDVSDFPSSSIHPPISTLDSSIRDYVTGETSYNGKTTTVLSVERILKGMILQ